MTLKTFFPKRSFLQKLFGGRIIFFYFMRLFALRMAVVFVIILSLIFIFEFWEAGKLRNNQILPLTQQLYIAGLKIPSLCHQFIPFVIFFSTLLFLWRLNRSRELVSFRSSGLSVWQLMMPLILLCVGVSVLDLCYLQPVGQNLLKERENITTPLGIHEKRIADVWVQREDDTGHMIFHLRKLRKIPMKGQLYYKSEPMSLFLFSPPTLLKLRCEAKRVIFHPEGMLMRDVWVLRPHVSPQFFPLLRTALAIDPSSITLEEQKDPRLKTFAELRKEDIKRGSMTAHYHTLRWNYLLAHALWLVGLVILALAFSLSYRHGLSAFAWTTGGLLACFAIFTFKEFAYVFGFSHPSSSVFLCIWLSIIFTFVLGFSVLFEKNEL